MLRILTLFWIILPFPNAQEVNGDAMLMASVRGDIAVVRRALDSGVNPDYRDIHECTALMYSAGNVRNPAVTKLLLRRGAAVNLQDQDGLSPLMQAAVGGNVENVKLLLAHGAQIEQRDHGDMTPLLWACLAGEGRVIELLLTRGADAKAQDTSKATSLTRCAGKVPATVLGRLIAGEADVNARDGSGWTPLMHSMMNEDVAAAELLIRNKARVNDVSKDGMTALMAAAARGNARLVYTLLKNGANSLLRDSRDRSALDHAKSHGHRGVIQLLENYAATGKLGRIPPRPKKNSNAEGRIRP